MGWIKVDFSEEDKRFLFGQNNFNLSIDSSGKLVLLANGTQTNYDEVLPIKQWIHVGATYSNTNEELKLFVNGKPVKVLNKSGALNSDFSLFTLGRNASTNSEFFKGYIDEIRIFDKALFDDEYQKIIYQEIEDHGQVRGTEIPRDITTLSWSNLIRYYRFDSYRHDITGNLAS